MDALRFAWDARNASANLRKHNVSFTEAETVFTDDSAILLDDPGHSKDEGRSVLLGLSERLRILVVSHTLRDGGRTIRIISAREATSRSESRTSNR